MAEDDDGDGALVAAVLQAFADQGRFEAFALARRSDDDLVRRPTRKG